MGLVLRLVTRIAKDESRRLSLRDGNEHNHNARDEDSELPWWAILVIVHASIVILVFLLSLIYYWKRGKVFSAQMQHYTRSTHEAI